MKLMVVGGGGREHAIIRKLKENPTVTEIFALPGNGGIAADATCVNISATALLPLRKKIRLIMRLSHRMIRWCLAALTGSMRSAFLALAPRQMRQLLKAVRHFPRT